MLVASIEPQAMFNHTSCTPYMLCANHAVAWTIHGLYNSCTIQGLPNSSLPVNCIKIDFVELILWIDFVDLISFARAMDDSADGKTSLEQCSTLMGIPTMYCTTTLEVWLNIAWGSILATSMGSYRARVAPMHSSLTKELVRYSSFQPWCSNQAHFSSSQPSAHVWVGQSLDCARVVQSMDCPRKMRIRALSSATAWFAHNI